MPSPYSEFGLSRGDVDANIPPNASEGAIFYGETSGAFKGFNGTDWQQLSDAGANGSAGANRTVTKTLAGLADNTNGALATITVPDVIAGALVRVVVTGVQGDGDSVDSKEYLISISRVAGENAKAVIGTAYGEATTVGVTSTAATTVSLGSVTGAVGVANTIAIEGKVARSAGTATGHSIVAEVQVLNGFAGGVTVQ